MQAKKLVIVLFMMMIGVLSNAQSYQLGIGLSNNVTSFPITGIPKIFYSQFHPGLDIIAEKQINKKVKNQWWAEGNLGVLYHRFFQTAVKLNVNLHYRYYFKPRFFSDIALGGGYLHSFYHYQVFKLNSNGDYVRESGWKGRPQFCAGIILGAGVGLKKSDPELWKLLFQFRTSVQGIFAGSFVPIVPYNSFLIGVTHRFNYSKTNKTNTNEK